MVSSFCEVEGLCIAYDILIEYADITKECVIIGANDRLEVWSKESWDKFLKTNEEEFENIAENLFNEGDYDAL